MDKICNQAKDIIYNEIKKEENQAKLQKEVLDPIVKYIGERLYPYILLASTILCLFAIIILYTLFLIYRINNNKIT
jgi:hypothetical protein